MALNTKNLECVMKALANRRRLEILRLLKSTKEMNVGSIAEEIKLSFRATSRHLAVLSAAGLLDREQRSLEMFYSLASDMPTGARTVISLV